MPLPHELHRMPAVAGQLLWAIKRELEPVGWEWGHKRTGYNSYYIWLPNSLRELHFRWHHSDEIDVYNRYYLGRKVATLRDDRDVARFVLSVLRNKI